MTLRRVAARRAMPEQLREIQRRGRAGERHITDRRRSLTSHVVIAVKAEDVDGRCPE